MNPFALGPRAIAVYNVVRYMNLRVEGAGHLPAGAALIAARHYHHVFDGSALVHGLPRQPHLFVALDWVRSTLQRRLMETVCGLAEWPVTIRTESFGGGAAVAAFERRETQRYVRRAISYGAELLVRGEWLAVFPEGYPTIDPAGSPKRRDDEYLPFRPGLLAIVARAQRSSARLVPIVPAGLAYALAGKRTNVTLRLGAPLFFERGTARAPFLAELQGRVRELSR